MKLAGEPIFATAPTVLRRATELVYRVRPRPDSRRGSSEPNTLPSNSCSQQTTFATHFSINTPQKTIREQPKSPKNRHFLHAKKTAALP
jgi:hypothetical protein